MFHIFSIYLNLDNLNFGELQRPSGLGIPKIWWQIYSIWVKTERVNFFVNFGAFSMIAATSTQCNGLLHITTQSQQVPVLCSCPPLKIVFTWALLHIFAHLIWTKLLDLINLCKSLTSISCSSLLLWGEGCGCVSWPTLTELVDF